MYPPPSLCLCTPLLKTPHTSLVKVTSVVLHVVFLNYLKGGSISNFDHHCQNQKNSRKPHRNKINTKTKTERIILSIETCK